ncbi:MAG: DUF1549 and DUF1553 domain-containing protein [Fimbriiglobus sp.]
MRNSRRLTLSGLVFVGACLGMLAMPSLAELSAQEKGAEKANKADAKKELRQKMKEELRKKAAEDAKKPSTLKPTPSALPTRVIPAALPTEALQQKIDAIILSKLAAEKVAVSPQATDAEFLRRAYLDIVGVIPTLEAARKFLDDKDPAKRTKLIDELLVQPGYGRHQADLWATKLFPVQSDNRFVLKEPLVKWLATEFDKNTPWDKFAANLITADGTVEENPAVTFYLANRTIDKLTDAVGTHILGQSVACAQCHNHPFTAMKQTEYWGLAGFFSKVNIQNPKNANKGGDNTKIGVSETAMPTKQKNFFPEAAMKIPPAYIGTESANLPERDPYRPALAKWVTSSGNPFFAKATVNRIWSQMFGQGLVNPVDDMHSGNPASHPELLDLLADQFIASGYDLKQLTRTIARTQAYQRSSKPTGDNAQDDELYSHRMIKVMIPEQLFDSLTAIQGGEISEPRAKGEKVKGVPPKARETFVNFFLAGAEVANPSEYEAGIPQALRLMNARQSISNNQAVAKSFVKLGTTPEKAIEEMFLATLSRRPTTTETEKMVNYVRENGKDSYADLFWVLTNSSEFVLIR